MRNFWMLILVGAVLLVAPSVGAARAQGGAQPNGGVVGVQGQNAVAPRQQEKPLDTAEAARQKQLSDETAKLLQLATELKAAVDKSNKNELSLDVVRKADDVEKLAHDLKQRLRS